MRRGTGRAWLAVVASLAAVAGGAAACGPDEPAGDGPTTTVAPPPPLETTPGDPGRAPEAFANGAAGGWGLVGATDRHLVGLAGPASLGGRVGEVVDLETGVVAELVPPPSVDGRPVMIDDAVFGSDAVIVSASIYEPGFDPETDTVDSGYDPPTDAMTYRLDPTTGAWTHLPLPEGVEGMDRRPFTVLRAQGRDGAIGVFGLGTFRAGLLARVEGDRWVEVADGGGDPTGYEACATSTDWWSLAEGGAATTLTATALADGAERTVTVPERLTDGDWELVAVGCSVDRLVLGVAGSLPGGVEVGDPAALVPLVLSTTDGEAWTEVDDPFGTTYPYVSGALSGVGPGVVVLSGMGMETDRSHPVVVGPGGAVADLPEAVERPVRFVLRGSRPEVLVLDPGDVDGGTVPVAIVDVPS